MIKFEQVAKQYPDGTTAVQSLSLNIKEGEFFVLIGPSGCGKTTTLKMINRLIPLSDGTIFINGKKISAYDIHELRWNIGYVLQQIALFPHMSIEENIAVVPEMRKWNRKKIEQRVGELLDMVGLDPHQYRKRKPSELSGGEQQRVGVIRALAADPEIILMDEPFSALDPISREKLQDDMITLQQNIKKTIVFVTHDMREALRLGDRICIMKDGEVLQVGTPEDLVENPHNDFVSNFVSIERDPLSQTMDLAAIMQPLNADGFMAPSEKAMPVSSTLKDALERLADEDQVGLERNGKVIGTINRQAIIKYLAGHIRERG
ncbi:ABC transporter ATP-binding protein [Camelliibacillus cellulosilyticus]|uniref:Quaternary amine transport ATP-binding protein n=1 Tax=Camelliibacillus cellulosilyticus TaxID=2174486 RepID=A0ABV9GHY2_9BACL